MGTSYAVTTDGTVNSGAPAIGYRVIMAVPWSGIGLTPVAGAVLGLDLGLDDLDGATLAANDWAAVTPFAQPIRWNSVQLAAPAGAGPGDGTGGNAESGGATGGGAGANAMHAGCSLGAPRPLGSSGAGAAIVLVFAMVALATCRRRRG